MKHDLLSAHDKNSFIDDGISAFVDIIEGCASSFKINIKQSEDETYETETSQPWYDDSCRTKTELFYICLKRFRRDKTERNRLEFIKARLVFTSTIRKARYLYNQQQTEKLHSLELNNAKEYWKLLKSAYCEPSPNINLSDFVRYFKVVNNPDGPFFTVDEDTEILLNRYLNDEIQVMFNELNNGNSIFEIVKAIKALKNGKASGPDRLINEFFINGEDILVPYLHTLFNTIFEKGYFPNSWSIGEIIPIHKTVVSLMWKNTGV